MLAVKSNYSAERQRVSQPQRQQNRDTSVRRSPAGLLDKLSIGAAIVLVLGVFWMLAGNAAKVNVMNHSVAQLQSQVSTVSAQDAALNTQVDELERPSRILSLALNKYHMKHANAVHISTNVKTGK
ncbi:hypothetical protein [Alicyclobacillus sp. SO9]|uniref:hypothetical protein n=1 Tax=Alicyclobacillus sp. SO9 TaxID=2665646 RepID=UPI0018E73F6B|nr:hypothetical protein [Alicyclobacillus sp. SO9]QQE80699.1 hypothetical protein GI364_10075 [Alicyclobacillus sp. SO9]